MVGSSAMVMWVESEDDKIFEYYLGGTSEDKVIHNSGDLPWTNASGYYHSSTSTAYLAFQLHTINDPLPFIIFAIGPQNSFPSAPNYLLSLHSDKISLKIDYDSGQYTYSIKSFLITFGIERIVNEVFEVRLLQGLTHRKRVLFRVS